MDGHVLELRRLRDGLLVRQRDPERFEFLTEERLQRLVAGTAACASDARQGRTSAGLETLGREAAGFTWEIVAGLDQGAGLRALVLSPRNADGACECGLWRAIEAVGWEAAQPSGGGVLFKRERVPVRGTARDPRPTLDVQGEALRILTVLASPKDKRLSTGPIEAAIREGLAPLQFQLERHEVVAADQPDTLGTLKGLLARQGPWHVLNVVAHGVRADIPGGALYLCDERGESEPVSYHDFAEHLRGHCSQVRLVTLWMCESSPLAVEIAERLPGVRVLAFLHEVREQTLAKVAQRFFGALFGDAHGSRGAPAGEGTVEQSGRYVEDAYYQAVRGASLAGEPEWFLPVLYTPERAQPAFELDGTFRDIFDLVRRGELDRALKKARHLEMKRSPEAVRARVLELCDTLQRMINIRDNLGLLRGHMREAFEGRTEWPSVYDDWRRHPMDHPRTAKPRIVSDLDERAAPTTMAPPIAELGEPFTAWAARAGELVDVVGELAGPGPAPVAAAVGRMDVGPEAPGLYRSALARLLRDIAGDIDALHGAPPGRFATERARHLCDRLSAIVADLRDAVSGSLVTPLDKEEWTRRVAACAEGIAAVVDAHLAPAGGCEPALFAPGRRAELVEHLLGGAKAAEATSTRAPRELAALSRFLEEMGAARDEAEAWVTPSALGPELLTLVANEAAPTRLVARREDAKCPYLALHAVGGHYDLPADSVHDLRIDRGVDHRRRSQLQEAMNVLRNVEQRLVLDAVFLPTADAPETTRRFERIAAAVFRGAKIPEEVFAGVDPVDQVVLLAAAGRPAEAAAAAERLALEAASPGGPPLRAAARFERVRAAYLTALHAAELAPDATAFARWMRAAAAALGALLVAKDGIAAWVGRRYDAYGSLQPKDDGPAVRAVEERLGGLYDRVLGRASVPGVDRALARTLSEERESEIRGARALTEFGGPSSRALPLRGGFLFLGASGGLAAVVADLASSYTDLLLLKQSDYLAFASERVTKDKFHDLVCLFSELRRALVSEACGSELARLLPDRDEWPDGEVGRALAARMGAADFAASYPFHAALSRDEAARVLAAHVAIAYAQLELRAIRAELAKSRPSAKVVSMGVRRVIDLDGYLAAVGYVIAGAPPSHLEALDDLAAGWASSVVESSISTHSAREDSAREVEHRHELEAACGVADAIARVHSALLRLRYGGSYAELLARCGIYVANWFRDGEAALGYLRRAHGVRTTPHVVRNLLAATLMRHSDLRFAGRRDEARVLAEAGIASGEAFLASGAAAGSDEDREDVIDSVKRLRDGDVTGATITGKLSVQRATPVSEGK